MNILDKLHRAFDREYAHRCDEIDAFEKEKQREQMYAINRRFKQDEEDRKNHPGSIRTLTYHFADATSIEVMFEDLMPMEIEALEKVHGGLVSTHEFYMFVSEEKRQRDIEYQRKWDESKAKEREELQAKIRRQVGGSRAEF